MKMVASISCSMMVAAHLLSAGEGISSSIVGDYFDELDMSNIEDFDSELTLSN